MLIGRRAFLGGAAVTLFFLPAARCQAEAAHRRVSRSAEHRHQVRAHKLPLVMLDPGHGGKDPGAIGESNVYEKRIALAAAHVLKRQLERTGKCRVRLTRARDVFIPLAGRVALAEKHGASLFISMHADALRQHTVRGASVYTYAVNASDPLAAAMATSENSADRFAPPQLRHLKPDVRRILSSLIVEEARMGSAEMQKTLVSRLDRRIRMLPKPAREARFAVLRSASIPSVLVEMGFMSNRLDERLLRQPRHRAVIAAAMTGAVERYLTLAHNAGLFSG